MKDIPVLNTVEDLVAKALVYNDKRYKLTSDINYEWDDTVAGEAWKDAETDEVGEYVSYRSPGHEAYEERERVWKAKKPSMHPVERWSLSSGYSREFALSGELGEQLDAIWTKKTGRYSSTEQNTSTLTLPGMLKRLGRTDIAKQIKTAEDKRKAEQEKYARNNLRRNLNGQLAELEKWVGRYGAEIGVTAEMFQLPVELEDKLVEEE